MRNLHIIMPMAGEGSRFLKEGWTIPKPLIELKGIPLFLRAINSIVSDEMSLKYSFIVREEHLEKYHIGTRIKTILSDANIFSVKKTTRGAVETCLYARSVIREDDAILVLDCDLEFKSLEMQSEIKNSLNKGIENVNGGLLVSFKSSNPRYSYALVDESNRVIKTAEKELISENALCGAYFFSSGRDFLWACNKLMNELNFTKPEYYVSLLYNYLLERGDFVKLCHLDEYQSYGTPEELKAYLND